MPDLDNALDPQVARDREKHQYIRGVDKSIDSLIIAAPSLKHDEITPSKA
jgi:hypothetical protein